MNSISPSSADALSNLINVSEKDDVPMTTSLKVAEIFGKMHKNVLQVIDNLDCSKEFKDANFQPCVYEAKSGFGYRKFRMYRLTRDGFVLLTMGFTGAKAAQFKQWCIAEFNRMEQYISNMRQHGEPQSLIEALELAINQAREKEALGAQKGMMASEAEVFTDVTPKASALR